MTSRAYITLTSLAALWMSALATGPATGATIYSQTNLVSDLPGVAAHMDPDLVNPWGIDHGPGTFFWISDNGADKSTLYNGSGSKQGLVVGIPNGAPTGVVFNPTSAFPVGGNKALFVFASEAGAISAWNGGTSATIVKDHSSSGAVYKGITIANVGATPRLYATNFHAGAVDMFDPNFNYLGSFTDTTVSDGFAPFNVQNIGGNLFVTFAKQDAARHDDVAGPGNGFIDEFNPDGTLLRRFASGGELDSPWGLAMAPKTGFGDFSGDLLVGNFGDGTINAFDSSGTFKGKLLGKDGKALTNEGLWGLKFGDGVSNTNNGPADTLFFTAGIPGSGNVEDHGLFGSIAVVPEPGTYALVGGGLAFLVMLRKRISNPA